MSNSLEIAQQKEAGVSAALRCSGALLSLTLLLGGCNTDVLNQGRVEEESLARQNAQAALVRGAGRTLAQGINYVGYTGAAVSREIHPAGSTGSFGITNLWQNGELRATDGDLDDHWEFLQRGRWVAEQTVRFIDEAGPANRNTQQQALLFAGFANRVLGDNMCEAVFDGGSAQPNAEYWKRAEDFFTKAIAVQTGTMETAAYAGRAQARVYLGKWAEAEADAARVPTTFSYTLPYFDVGSDVQRNRIAWAVADNPYRAHTQWSTWYYDYRQATNDPRVPIRITTQTGDAAIECCGQVAFYPQSKYPNGAAAIRLASGREMRLIEAEAKLRASDVTGAVAAINAVRTAVPVATVTAANATEAWTLLKRERGIELWLEARRLGDLRRWRDSNTPGALNPLEMPGTASHLAKQDLCFPISRSERETNPNLR
jgi:starch-binding outer membrane protein, SusD/RagB family